MIEIGSEVITLVNTQSIYGFSTETNNQMEMQGNGRIAALWARFSALSDTAAEHDCFAVYYDYHNGVESDYSVLVGQEKSIQNCQSIDIASSKYHQFTAQGTGPQVVIELWQHIWAFYAQNHEEKHRFLTDFEHYECNDRVNIYIGIE